MLTPLRGAEYLQIFNFFYTLSVKQQKNLTVVLTYQITSELLITKILEFRKADKTE